MKERGKRNHEMERLTMRKGAGVTKNETGNTRLKGNREKEKERNRESDRKMGKDILR